MFVSDLMAEPNTTFIVLTWSPPQYPNGDIIAYEVSYTVENNFTTKNTTNTSMIIDRLPHGTIVSNISVRAYNSAGPGKSFVFHGNVSTLSPSEFMM